MPLAKWIFQIEEDTLKDEFDAMKTFLSLKWDCFTKGRDHKGKLL